MKGTIFTELIDFVEEQFGWETAEDMLDAAQLDHEGAYTAVGTYPHTEMLALVSALSEIVEMPVGDLVHVFGKHLFGQLAASHAHVIGSIDTSFELLARIEKHIHVEVLKLYPGAELPHFEIESPDPDTLHMHYHSTRPFATLALGLIEGCIEHYGEPLDVTTQSLTQGDGREATFIITRQRA